MWSLQAKAYASLKGRRFHRSSTAALRQLSWRLATRTTALIRQAVRSLGACSLLCGPPPVKLNLPKSENSFGNFVEFEFASIEISVNSEFDMRQRHGSRAHVRVPKGGALAPPLQVRRKGAARPAHVRQGLHIHATIPRVAMAAATAALAARKAASDASIAASGTVGGMPSGQ